MASCKMISSLSQLLKEAVENGVFPGAVAGIFYNSNKYIIQAGYKALCPFPEPLEETDIFDLASLTKPLALTFTFMYLLSKESKVDLYTPIGNYLDLRKDLAEIPVYRFFNHTAGLKAWYPFYKELKKEKGTDKLGLLIKKIEELSLEYFPGEKCLYSDLNYFILTYLLEKVYQKDMETLFEVAKSVFTFSRKAYLGFKPLEKGIDQEKIVPTSVCPWSKKILRGVVEDENTRALGGVSGVAGLFGNIYGVLEILEFLLKAYKENTDIISQEIVKEFLDFREGNFNFSLGFMLQSLNGYSATAGVFSDKTVGHLGFTGCSFFVDLERELIVVLLTNRVHPDRNNSKIRDFRPVFHKAVLESLESIR
ncbi:MAG: beta-lactamase family protein [Thermodesulfobacterium sp.]|nr:beta-lactamase family protein [Thermodesulfobacterium sp.]